ncbi:DUF4188 domain-containing protein [Henriciella litoralis]|uniref:DUF4188 domain-containing protein n=1 Tax=Henriciella litoralis TaxID=568102 RepID=UPI0009FEE154|nr:DUF4188 domain-containing protein [Henriciella litoralis]
MAKRIDKRMTVEIEGDFVVFLIGMRVNRAWKVWKWWPVMMAMPRMLIELAKQPELGLLHARTVFGFPGTMVIQYWRSFEQLHAYATDRTAEHLPAWKAFNNKVGTSGDVGIWHETYLVKAGAYEAVYNGVPLTGLANAGTPVAAEGRRKSARGRLKETDGGDAPDGV